MKPVYIKIDKYGSRYYYSDVSMKTLHRTDGPAVEHPDGSNEWRLNGQLHRTEGPACEYVDGCKEWYLNGKRLSEAKFLTATAGAAKNMTDDRVSTRLRDEVDTLERAPSVFVATVDSRHFSFMALSRFHEDARDALMRGWQKHCEDNWGADVDSIIREDIKVVELSEGQCARDETIIIQ